MPRVLDSPSKAPTTSNLRISLLHPASCLNHIMVRCNKVSSCMYGDRTKVVRTKNGNKFVDFNSIVLSAGAGLLA